MSTAQKKARWVAALALSFALHSALFAFLGVLGHKSKTEPRSIRMSLLQASPSRSTIHPAAKFSPLKKEAQGFVSKRAQENPHRAFSKEGVSTDPNEPERTGFSTIASENNSVGMPRGASPKSISKPYFTVRALHQGIEGDVVLRVLVGDDGRVKRAIVKKRLGYGLDEEAQKAILQSIFEPAQDSQGHPVDEEIDYTYKFLITERAT